MKVDDLIDLLVDSDADQISLMLDHSPVLTHGAAATSALHEAVDADDFAQIRRLLHDRDTNWRGDEDFSTGIWVADTVVGVQPFRFVVGRDTVLIRPADDPAARAAATRR